MDGGQSLTAEDKESSVRLQSEVARLSARLEASQRHAHELERELLAGVCMCVCVYARARAYNTLAHTHTHTHEHTHAHMHMHMHMHMQSGSGCGRWWPSATWWRCACGSRSLP